MRATFGKEIPKEAQIKVMSLIEHYDYDSFHSPCESASLRSNVVYEVRPCTSTLRVSFAKLNCANSSQMNLSAMLRLTI